MQFPSSLETMSTPPSSSASYSKAMGGQWSKKRLTSRIFPSLATARFSAAPSHAVDASALTPRASSAASLTVKNTIYYTFGQREEGLREAEPAHGDAAGALLRLRQHRGVPIVARLLRHSEVGRGGGSRQARFRSSTATTAPPQQHRQTRGN